MQHYSINPEPLVRLILAQGPLQLLTVISVLKSQRSLDTLHEYVDVLVLGGFFGDVAGDQKLTKACLLIAQAWGFKLIFGPTFLGRVEQEFYTGRPFQDCVESLKAFLSIDRVGVIYVVRNWQLVNELLLSAYPKARKVAYGDGLGGLDFIPLKHSHKIADQPFINLPDQASNPDGFIGIDEAYAITPIEMNYGVFDECKINFVSLDFFKETVQEAAGYIEELKQFCSSLSKYGDKRITFSLLSTLVDSELVAGLDVEISLYLVLIEASVQKDEVLFIKQHPRQTLNQSELLVKQLRQRGYDAHLVPHELACLPIELFTAFLPIRKVISNGSAGCFYLAYAAQVELVFGCGQILLQKYFRQPQTDLYFFEIIVSTLLQQAYSGKIQPILMADIQSSEVPQSPLYFRGQDVQPLAHPQVLQSRLTQLIADLQSEPFTSDQAESNRGNHYSSNWLQSVQHRRDLVMYLDCLPPSGPKLGTQICTDTGEILTAEAFTMYKTAAEERLQLIEQLHQQSEELQLQNQQLRRKSNSVRATAKALLRNVWRRFKLR